MRLNSFSGIISLLLLMLPMSLFAQEQILIPMNASQTDHLKAYGMVYNHLQDGYTVKWLLNYDGGSFIVDYDESLVKKSRIRNVAIEVISDEKTNQILQQVQQSDVNMSAVKLDKAPEIAVYTPEQSMPWDDAVTLALSYAEVPYDKVYDEDVLNGKLSQYDWLHLHHEDFTGQYGKFWVSYRNAPWYIQQVQRNERQARELGFSKVSNAKKAVARKIKEYIKQGGFMFAMCSGTDTFDIALSAQNVDIVPKPFDGDPPDPNAKENLDYSRTLAFEDYEIITNPNRYEHADIDVPVKINEVSEKLDFFSLFEFSAKWDPVPSMLTQNHVSSIKGFYGQTTAFRKDKVKESVVIMAESAGRDWVKYLHGNYGKGTFTFYAGHDPEDYTHRVNDPPTDLSLHPNSPGYRLILNNILFPAAKKKKRKT